MRKKQTIERYTLADLENWGEVARNVKPPIRLGVFGDPVAHSLSPKMQNAALEHCKIPVRYAPFQVTRDELADALEQARRVGFVGLNVTIPHKLAALDLMNDVEENAKGIGAINVVKIEKAKLIGFNTDGRGFAKAIREEFSVDLRDLRVMVLGAGGAARAIAWECAKASCERLVIANRAMEKGKTLADSLRNFFEGPKVFGPVPRLQAIPWDENALRFQIGNIDLVVNATPVGMNRGDPSPIAARLLAPHLMVYDTVYSTERTPLVLAALEAGARTANGLSMLLHQGALAFEIWFGREAPIEVMRKVLVSSG